MKRYASSDIPHTASTDHRILRRPASWTGAPLDMNVARFADFYRDRFPLADPQAERNLGLGLVKMMTGGVLRPERHGPQALLALEAGLGQFPNDSAIRGGKVQVLALLGRHSEALEEARLALVNRPGDWRLLALAAGAAQATGHEDAAIDYWRQAIGINPNVAEYHVRLVDLLQRTGQLEEARTRCARLLELDPFNVSGRQALVDLLLKDGKTTEARREFETIRRLRPPDLAKRELWFQQRLR